MQEAVVTGPRHEVAALALRGGPSRTVQTIVRERATKRAGDRGRLVLAIGINPLQVTHLSTISLSIRLIDCPVGLFLC
jgi:hypothetical protein